MPRVHACDSATLPHLQHPAIPLCAKRGDHYCNARATHVRLFFRHWLAFMGAILLVIVPLQVIAAGVTWAVAPEQLEWNSSTSSGEDPDLLLWQGIVALIGFLTLLLVNIVLAIWRPRLVVSWWSWV